MSELPEVSARQEHERDEADECVERLALQVVRRVVRRDEAAGGAGAVDHHEPERNETERDENEEVELEL